MGIRVHLVTMSDRRVTERAIRLRRVFYRWLWLVYFPLVLGLVGIGVLLAGVLPGFLDLPLAVLLVWGALAVRLLVERHRRKVPLRVPPTLILGLGALLGLVVGGIVLAWMGVDRLASRTGPPLLVVGAFLLVLALLAPAFKVVDLTLRLAVRNLLRLGGDRRRPQRPPSQQRRQAA